MRICCRWQYEISINGLDVYKRQALAFIRGRSLSETYCIIDEAQNLTPHEIKTILTRAGEGTKMVFTGDIQQIDQPYLDSQSNGLVYMIDRMRAVSYTHLDVYKRQCYG